MVQYCGERILTAFINLLGFGFTLLRGSWVPRPRSPRERDKALLGQQQL